MIHENLPDIGMKYPRAPQRSRCSFASLGSSNNYSHWVPGLPTLTAELHELSYTFPIQIARLLSSHGKRNIRNSVLRLIEQPTAEHPGIVHRLKLIRLNCSKQLYPLQ
jgi:hypothetical protein